MKLKTLILVILVLSALAVVACTPQETLDANQDEVVEEQSPAETVGETAQEDILTEDDFVEIGEMI